MFFTLNHIKPNFIEQSHQTSARYDKTISEFDVVGLSPYFTDALMAPYVKESDIRIGLKYVEKIQLKSNNTVLVVGEIIELMLPEKKCWRGWFYRPARCRNNYRFRSGCLL